MEHRAPWPWAPSARCVLERAAVAPAHSTYHARSVSAAAERPVRPGARRRSLAALLLGVSAVLSRCPSAARAKLLRSSREVARSKLEDGSEVVKLASGVQYVDRRVGRGEVPQMGDVVLAHVKGYLMEKDDPIFIDTYSDGAPLVFSLGTMTQGITEGLEEALATMTLGSVRLVQVPSYMGYPNGLARVGVKPPLSGAQTGPEEERSPTAARGSTQAPANPKGGPSLRGGAPPLRSCAQREWRRSLAALVLLRPRIPMQGASKTTAGCDHGWQLRYFSQEV
ncbi:unnamed protein product [Durusdinium trenchii]|uniref:peptidylprolyl isomerase n=1 Tax=Durusdinium trenchii TaxID=1381693 RepID=A0ABP0NYU5_9DINO